MELPDKLRELARLKAAKQLAKEQYEAAEQACQVLEAQLHETMEELGLRTIKTDDHTFTRKSTVYGTVQDFEKFAKWCVENDLVDEFIQQTEQRGNLNQLVRDRQDNKQALPPGVGFRVRNYISTSEN